MEYVFGILLVAILFCGIMASPPKWPTDEEARERLRKENR